jgi:hypothetical protein
MFQLISHRTEDALSRRIERDRCTRMAMAVYNSRTSTVSSPQGAYVARFWLPGMMERSR